MSPTGLTLIFGVSIALVLNTCFSQTFDPNMNDKEYLDSIQQRLHLDVVKAQTELIKQAKVLREVTRSFIETKIKTNLFKAVRQRVEMELDMMAQNNVTLRKGRQDDNEEDDDSTTPRPRPPGLLPQLANVVTTIFGPNVNVTGYLKDATSFLPPDLSYRIISAASLIDPDRFTSTTTTTTPAPVIVNGQVVPVNHSAYIDYQFGIASPPTLQNPGVGVVALGQGLTMQQSHHPSTVKQPGADRVFQGVAQQTGQDRVVQGVTVTQSVSEIKNSAPVQLQQRPTQPQTILANGGQSQVQQTPAFQPVASGNRVTTAVVPASGAIIIQPELPIVQSTNNLNQQYIPSIQIASNIPSVTPAADTSDEEEENEESSEISDDLEIVHDDDTEQSTKTFAEEYPVISHAFNFINRIRRTRIPTTTEFTNVTRKSIDSIEEEEAAATSPATTTFQTIVQGGVYIFEGAREAYTLLQQLNKYIDRVGDTLDNAGFGVDPATTETDE